MIRKTILVAGLLDSSQADFEDTLNWLQGEFEAKYPKLKEDEIPKYDHSFGKLKKKK